MIDEKILKMAPEVVFSNLVNRRLHSDDPEIKQLVELEIVWEIYLLRTWMKNIIFYDRVLAFLHEMQNALEDEIKKVPNSEKKAIAERAKENKKHIAFFEQAKAEDRKKIEDDMTALPNLTLSEFEYLQKMRFYEKEKQIWDLTPAPTV